MTPDPPSREEGDTTHLITSPDGHPVALEVISASLEVISGPDAGLKALIEQPVYRVGTSPSNDLALTDGAVSKLHFSILTSERGFTIRDHDSTNGLEVGAVRVRDAWLSPGALITAGRTVLRFSPRVERYELPLSEAQELAGMVGGSPAMRQVFTWIQRVAPNRFNVLIEGESGTGKEHAARALHDLSGRPAHRWVVVDCSCLTRDLIEDELFGHVKGAFTHALSDRRGAFTLADGGTLFLDEVGELPLDLQPKLLRVLQERQFTPLGGDRPQRSDFRLIAATNRDLHEEVNRGRFREDLFHRLATLRLRMPPLRERPQDVPQLLERFIEEAQVSSDGPQRPFGRIPQDVIRDLQGRPWPGNVRQLRNYAIRLMVRREMGPLGLADFMDSTLLNVPAPESVPDEGSDFQELLASLEGESNLFQAGKKRLIDAYERRFVQHFLREANMVVARAAALAGLRRQEFNRIMWRQDIRRGDPPSEG